MAQTTTIPAPDVGAARLIEVDASLIESLSENVTALTAAVEVLAVIVTAQQPAAGGPADKPADLLYGAQAIAAHLRMTRRQVYCLIDDGELPTFKMGKTVCATRSVLAAHFAAHHLAAKMRHAEAAKAVRS